MVVMLTASEYPNALATVAPTMNGSTVPSSSETTPTRPALRGGPVAVLAAIASVALCAGVISVINRTERSEEAPIATPTLHANPLLAEAE